MKRLILTVTGTVAGLISLLSFKTETASVASTGTLPSAGTAGQSATSSGASATTTPSAASHSTATSGSSSMSQSSTSSSSSSATTTKSYTGSAITTRYGVIQVKVTVSNGKITNVAFVQLTAFDGRSQQINSNAGPQLLQETLSAQSAQVDTVSGASYTSDGYRQSLQSALDKAGI